MLKNRSKLAGRAPRLGKIKVGEKAEGGRPTSVDYFIIDSEYKDLVTKAYGEKPKVLNIVFPSNDVEENMKEMYRWYGKSGLKCTGDGETYTQFIDTVEEPPECPCFRSRDDLETKPQCHASMILSFIITGIGVTGVWHFTSKAIFSRSGVRAVMEMVQATTGKLAGVPFFLRVEMQKSTIADNPNKFPVVSIDCAMDLEALMKQNLQIETIEIKQLDEHKISQAEQIKPEPEEEKKNPLGLTKLAVVEWDKMDKYLEENKGKLSDEKYKGARDWLDSRTKSVTNLKISANYTHLVETVDSGTTSGRYQHHHESLITACCDTLKSEDRISIIKLLDGIVANWDIDGKETLADTSENECLNILDEFDKIHKPSDSDDDDLPF